MSKPDPTSRRLCLARAVGSGIGLAGCALPSATIEAPQATATTKAPEPAKAERAKAKAARKSASRGQGPSVVAAELTGDGDRLRLEFSEPLGPLDGVDPNDFRLSVALSYVYKLYAYAYYYDPGEAAGEELMSITAMTLGAGGEGATLELRLEPAFPLSYCAEMEAEVADMRGEPGVRAEGGLYLHYAPGEVPITDVEGNDMDAIAAEWALRRRRGGDEAYEMYFEGARARRALREAIPVRCEAGS